MKKNFTVILPDEPFKSSTAMNKTVHCVYEGLRYIVGRMNNTTKKVENSVGGFDNNEDIDLSFFTEDGYSFIVIDATVNPFEAAFLTETYSHSEVDNYVETLSTGETWEHTYDNYSGILSQIYKSFDLEYDSATKTFKEPSRISHPIVRESLFDAYKDFPKRIEDALSTNDYSDEERTKLENYKTWLENLSTTYANVDHWKIPFPVNIPNF